ncbi:defensin-like [Rhodnius prolixus]|uniref:Defensin B n=2 Tax=Arthropoda TaxID=6656 RepID=Q86MY2_RHOPR|nr:defensin B [Rhodnius prolixus]AHY02942.1 defensin B J [Rhodnius prolixus]
MKCILSLVTLFLVAVLVHSHPAEWNTQQELDDALWEPAGEVTEEHVARLKRATCDLLSFSSKWVTPNHAGCAAHCLLRGNRGGHCKGTICHCRK